MKVEVLERVHKLFPQSNLSLHPGVEPTLKPYLLGLQMEVPSSLRMNSNFSLRPMMMTMLKVVRLKSLNEPSSMIKITRNTTRDTTGSRVTHSRLGNLVELFIYNIKTYQ